MHRKHLYRRGALAAVAGSVLALAACSSASTASGGGSSPSASASGSTAASVGYAQQQIAKYSGTSATFTAPGPALKNVASLRGKVVYYVPIGLTVPYFQVVLSGLRAAAGAAGLTVRPCDPAFSPSGVAQCLSQAAHSGAAAVITDSIPNAMAQQGINVLQSRHIPILVGDQGSHPGTDELAYNSPPTELLTSLEADWIIAESKGTGDIILPEITDSAASIGYVENGAIPEIHTHCPGCKLTVIKTSTEQLSSLPSLISTALIQDPHVGYVLSEFDADVSAIIHGLQTVSAARGVKVTGINGVLSNLQFIAQGNYQAEDTGDNGYQFGWASIDQVLRQLLGQPVISDEHVGVRVFTAANVTGLTLTTEAANTGEWYGSGDFKQVYQGLWGVSP
jgi:ribose transport system substrate-binding protein